MSNIPSNSDDVIDSRDIIDRIEELQDERAELESSVDELKDWDISGNAEELKALLELQEQAEGYAPDWKHGATLIAESYFTEYCEELCKDIGDIPQNIPEYLVIDWDATANNLRADYTEVDFDGVTYLIR